MTTYGTIPTESLASSTLPIFIRAKQHIHSTFSTRRPWKEMIPPHSLNPPTSFGNFLDRARTNAAIFRMNYAIIVLFILFVSLLWHPISLIAYILMIVAWLFLYFLRDDPLTVLGYMVDDCLVLIGLSLATFAVLFLTNVTNNIIGGLSIGMVVILVHGILRNPDDLFFVDDDDQQGRSTALFNSEHIKSHAASSSFNSS
ncbi:hypothetical protein Pint_13375 [Pistacia integerrima]|uniref:Uncharacterized protein n=1 Tax=Pistacia integerrima TaxID=434235 RepID=A0ACC0Y5S2_9ROSI|nr:hypothetical protein Pint_13375 [Pistacia integerrima]